MMFSADAPTMMSISASFICSKVGSIIDVVDKVVRLLTAAALATVFFLIIIAVLMFFSFAFAFWLAQFTGTAFAFFVVAVLHLLVFILFAINRKRWIEKPLVHFLAGLFLSK